MFHRLKGLYFYSFSIVQYNNLCNGYSRNFRLIIKYKLFNNTKKVIHNYPQNHLLLLIFDLNDFIFSIILEIIYIKFI